MKKFSLIAAIGVCLCTREAALGQVIAYESFSGIRLGTSLFGSGSDAFGWSDSAWAGGADSRYQIVDPTPQLSYQIGGGAFLDGSDRAVQLTTAPEPVPMALFASRMCPEQNTTIYLSFLVRPLSVGSGSDALTLQIGNGESVFDVVGLRPALGEQHFNLTVGQGGPYDYSRSLEPSTTYLVVARITWPPPGYANQARIDSWINPPAAYPGDGTGLGFTYISAGLPVLRKVGLGISSADIGGPTSTAIFDELRIGYTWADVVPPGPPRLANISTRGLVQTNDKVLIGGFILTGTQPKKVMVRAIGPSLPLAGQLQNPSLELYDSSSVIDSNDDWVNAPNKQEIIDSTIAPASDSESVLLTTLPANNAGYTAIVRGVNNSTGIGLVEVYDLGNPQDSALANISTRGLVQTGDNVMIGGLIVAGADSQKIILRAIGPSLPVSGQLADPTLDLYDGNGSLIASNDNWRDTQQAEILATGIAPTNDAEAAIVQTLVPSAYTSVVRGKNGATGIALVEAYALAPEGALR